MDASKGPFVALAVFCDKVLREQDGVLSLIRIVDRLTFGLSGPAVPKEMPTVSANLTLIIGFKAGAAHGRQTIIVRPYAPSGQSMAKQEIPMLFESADRGANAVLQMVLEVNEEGVYWFSVCLNDESNELTRVPLRVQYQPTQFSS